MILASIFDGFGLRFGNQVGAMLATKTPPRRPQDAPKTPQDAPKAPPGAPKMPPRGLPVPPERPPAPSQRHFWLQTCPKRENAKNPCKTHGFWHFQEASKGFWGPQIGPRRPPGGPKSHQGRPQEALWGPGTASGTPPRRPQEAPQIFMIASPAPSTVCF